PYEAAAYFHVPVPNGSSARAALNDGHGDNRYCRSSTRAMQAVYSMNCRLPQLLRSPTPTHFQSKSLQTDAERRTTKYRPCLQSKQSAAEPLIIRASLK